MPRGIPGSGPNGNGALKAVETFTVLTGSQKTSLLNSVQNIQTILGGAGLAQHAMPAKPIVRRRRRRNTTPAVQPQV